LGDLLQRGPPPAERAVAFRRSPVRQPTLGAAAGAAVCVIADAGRAAWLVFSFAIFAWVAYRAGARPLAMGLFLASPLTVGCLLTGNMDWVSLLGFMLPPQIGLPIVLIKPHIGIAMAVYWIIGAFRQGRLKQVIRLVYPTVLIYLASFLVYGLWLTNSLSILDDSHGRWNISLWPYSIPIGLALLVIGIARRQAEWTWGASPLLSPYASFNVFNGLPLAIVKKPWLLGPLVAVMWFAVWLIR
jgi:hypothetical protein